LLFWILHLVLLFLLHNPNFCFQMEYAIVVILLYLLLEHIFDLLQLVEFPFIIILFIYLFCLFIYFIYFIYLFYLYNKTFWFVLRKSPFPSPKSKCVCLNKRPFSTLSSCESGLLAGYLTYSLLYSPWTFLS
jgi:hypothetical protein